MAGDSNSKPPKPIPRQPGGRTTPVLVPQGALAGQPDVPLDRPVTTFGSNDNARLHLLSRTISKGHGIFVNSGEVTYVADLASRTGVLVNGKLIRDVDLKTGDRVQIGKFVFRYRSPANQAPPPPATIPPAASVIVVGSPAKPIDGRVFQIGRRENSDVSFANDPAVSAGHAVIFEMDGRWYLRDLGSRTGTTVNGKSIHQQALSFGDRIVIGSSTILFQPGVSAVDEIAQPEVAPELHEPAEAAEAQMPVDRPDEDAVPASAADDQVIPLADDLPLQGVDWKAAFPLPDPEPEIAPVVPVGTALSEAAPVAEPATDFAELERLAEENLAEAAEPAAVETRAEPSPVEEVVEPVVEEHHELSEQPAEPGATEPTETSALEGAAGDMAEAMALLGAAEETSPIEDHATVEPLAAEEAEIPVEQPIPISAPLAIAEEQPAAEIPAPTAAHPLDKPAAVASSPKTVDPTELASPLDDFVFLPVDEQAAALPEVIFWGDSELDLAAEQAAVKSPTAAPVAVPIDTPSLTVEDVQPLTAGTDEEALAQPVLDFVATATPVDVVEDVAPEPIDELAPAENAEILEDNIAAPAVDFDATAVPVVVVEDAVPEPIDELAPAENAEILEDNIAAPVVDFVATAVPVDVVEIVAPEPVDGSAGIEIISDGLEEAVEESSPRAADEAEVTAREPGFVDESELDGEIPLVEENSGEDQELLDPLSDSFPLVEPVEDLVLPRDLLTFAETSSASAGVYVPTASVVPVAPGSAAVVVSSDLVADEVLDLPELEFLEPESESEVTQSTAAADVSGVSTVDEISPAEDFTLTDQLATAEVEPRPEIPQTEEITEAADEASEVSGVSAAEVPAEDDLALGEESWPVDVEPEAGESDLEFLDFTAEQAETATEAPPVAEIPSAPSAPPQKPAEATGAGHGPSIFGFDFEGGSFLGGLPISLTGPAPAAPAAPAISPTPSSPVFDARATPPSGLGQMLAALPVAPQPPRPAARPMTPPRPAIRPPGATAAPTSLTGLVSEAALPWTAPPVIPPTTRDPALAPKPGAGPRKALTSNFTAPGAAARVTEVFSQMSAPIGVEVFGGRPGDPNQFTVPDSKETAAEQSAQAEATPAPARVLEPPPAKKARWSRLPFLLLLMVLIPAILAASIYKFVPVSSQVMGSIEFVGLVPQQMTDGVDSHAFHLRQEALIGSSAVREGQPVGFTSDDTAFTSVLTSQSLNWSGNTLQFTYNTTDEALGTAQVNAVMMSLAQKDRDLDVARETARAAAAAAKTALDDSSAKVQEIIKQRREMDDKAQDRPDAAIVAQANREADKLNQQWLDAKNIRLNTQTALAELRSQDPTREVDIETDPQVLDLKKQLQPLLDQIAKLKGTGSIVAGSAMVAGTDVSVNATTQPVGDINPLVTPLQQQADLLSKKMEVRRADLKAQAAIGPDQRAVNQARAIDDLSVKITDLQKIETDAKAATDQATAKANEYHALVSAANLASFQAQELVTKQTDAVAEQTRARNDSEEKEAALTRCITVKLSTDTSPNPATGTILRTDLRPRLAIGSSVGAWVFLLAMIIGELRRPKLMTSVTPAAAPRVNPPVKLVPWPQSRELDGLEHKKNNEPPVMGEQDRVFGV